MGDGHSHRPEQRQWGRAFGIGILLNVAFVIVEVIYGLSANSSALLADAGHNTSDVLSLLFAWSAIWIAAKKPSGRYTYRLRRTTILASILNGLLVLIAVGFIAWDALEKFYHPETVAGKTVMMVAAIGVVINAITALMFMHGRKADLNIQGAFLHMAADAAVSLGVVVAGTIIQYTGALWIDPLVSMMIVIVIVAGTWRLLRDSVDLALDAVPKSIDLDEVRRFLETRSGIDRIQDLHIWGMSTTESALTAHLVAPEGVENGFVHRIGDELRARFGIAHTTLQIETGEHNGQDCSHCDS